MTGMPPRLICWDLAWATASADSGWDCEPCNNHPDHEVRHVPALYIRACTCVLHTF